MRQRRLVLIGLAGALLACDTGCFFRRWRDPHYRREPLFGRRDEFSSPPPGTYPPGPFASPGGSPPIGYPPGTYPSPNSAPPGIPGTPGGPEILTPQNGTGLAPSQSGYPFPPGGLRPADHRVPIPPAPNRSTAEPPLARATPFTPPPRVEKLPPDLLGPTVTENVTTIPPTSTDPSPNLPVDIVGYAEPKERLATGRRPGTEGLDWLQRNGFQTVLHLRRPGVEDSADREQVEKRGMRYQSIAISANSLTKDVVDEFNRLIGDAENLPLLVYDRDGMLAGTLWYLHFRSIERMPEQLARIKAESYGLRTDGNEEASALWSAAQRLPW